MDFNFRHQPVGARDDYLRSVKQEIQEQSRQELARGNLSQSDLFLVRPEVARRATVTLNGVSFREAIPFAAIEAERFHTERLPRLLKELDGARPPMNWEAISP